MYKFDSRALSKLNGESPRFDTTKGGSQQQTTLLLPPSSL